MNLQCGEADCVFEQRAVTRVSCSPTRLVDAAGALCLGFPFYVMVRRSMGENTACICLVRAYSQYHGLGLQGMTRYVQAAVTLQRREVGSLTTALGQVGL